MVSIEDIRAQLERLRTGLTNVAEDIRRIKEQLSNPGLTEEEEAAALAELTTVADTLQALDEENQPPPPPPPVEPPTG